MFVLILIYNDQPKCSNDSVYPVFEIITYMLITCICFGWFTKYFIIQKALDMFATIEKVFICLANIICDLQIILSIKIL